MTVITMTREMGSLGKDVAAGVAEAMGLEVIHHEVIERDVADRMKLGESDVHRFLEGKPSLLDRWKIDQKTLSHYTAEEILEIAVKDNVVIRGWGATALLRTVPHVVRLRVCAPMAFRVRVLKERLEIKDSHFARREIERNDAAHTRALRGVMNSDWESALNYDMVLNTERVPISDCVDQVVALAKSRVFAKTAASQRILNDLIVESRVRNRIAHSKELSVSVRHVDISFSDGNLILTGVVDRRTVAQALCRELEQTPGVKSVTNELTVLPAYRG